MGRPPSTSEARRLLGLDAPLSSSSSSSAAAAAVAAGVRQQLTKSQIQRAYVEAARLHHPDARHRPGARPCAETFRSCHEARRVLLERYCGIGAVSAGSESGRGGSASTSSRGGRTGGGGPHANGGGSRSFGNGFPFRTLRILTLRQNLALRGMVFTFITIGTMYDEWTRYSYKKRRREMEGRGNSAE